MHELLLDVLFFPPVKKGKCKKNCCLSYSHDEKTCKVCKAKRLHK